MNEGHIPSKAYVKVVQKFSETEEIIGAQSSPRHSVVECMDSMNMEADEKGFNPRLCFFEIIPMGLTHLNDLAPEIFEDEDGVYLVLEEDEKHLVNM